MNILWSLSKHFLKLRDFLRYEFSDKKEELTIVLTFDDQLKENEMEIPKFLKEKGIKATFFLPPGKMDSEKIEKIVAMGHEVGGHGWNHDNQEFKNNYKRSSKRCFEYLKELYPDLTSWRFPGLKVSKKACENVKSAGFDVDSSKGTYYPVNSAKELHELIEIPFVRLPPNGQMDINVKNYETMSSFILEKTSEWKGIVVLPFHSWYQYKYFEEFKQLINRLLGKNIILKRLIDIKRRNS